MKFTGAQVLDLDSGDFKTTDIFVENDKFVQPSEASGDKERSLDGYYVTPGLIDAHSHIGMWEESIGFEGADGNEMTDPITPHLKAIDGINPMDIAFEDARAGGVTTVSTGPGSTNVIGGMWTIIKTSGNVIDEMVLLDENAMKCAFGENPKKYYGEKGNAPMTRMNIAAMLRKALNETKHYQKNKIDSINKGNSFSYNEKYEALIPVVEGKMQVKFHCHRADDIATVIRIVNEFSLKASIEHGTEGHLISEYISSSGIPVITGPTFGFKTKPELKNKTFETPAILEKAGVKIAIMTDCPVLPQSSLILWAAMANKSGLPLASAFKAITKNAAEILGVDDRVGSIEPGKDADFVVWDRHPFDLYAVVLETWINGKLVYKYDK